MMHVRYHSVVICGTLDLELVDAKALLGSGMCVLTVINDDVPARAAMLVCRSWNRGVRASISATATSAL